MDHPAPPENRLCLHCGRSTPLPDLLTYGDGFLHPECRGAFVHLLDTGSPARLILPGAGETPDLSTNSAVLFTALKLCRNSAPTLFIVAALFLVPQLVLAFLEGVGTISGTGTDAVENILNILMSAAFLSAFHRAWKREPLAPGEAIVTGLTRGWILLAASIINGVAVVIGLVLFIVPGVLFAVRFVLRGPIIVLEKRGCIDGLDISYKLVKGRFWPTTWPLISALLINIALIIPLLGAALTGYRYLSESLVDLIFDVSFQFVFAVGLAYMHAVIYTLYRRETASNGM